jgi:hypothetical protein
VQFDARVTPALHQDQNNLRQHLGGHRDRGSHDYLGVHPEVRDLIAEPTFDAHPIRSRWTPTMLNQTNMLNQTKEPP